MELKWPNKIVIIRHGQSEQNAVLDLVEDNSSELVQKQKDIKDADIKLTDLGIWQAEQTGLMLSKEEHFDICFSSPYVRTLQTAENIVKCLGYNLQTYKDNRLREKEFGRMHGYTIEEIKEKYPEEFHDRKRDGKYWYRPPGGENYPDVEDRIHSFLDKLHRDYKGKNVLIVTHQIPCKLFRALFEHLDEKEVLGLEHVLNCGIEEFKINTENSPEGRMVLSYFNKVAYEN